MVRARRRAPAKRSLGVRARRSSASARRLSSVPRTSRLAATRRARRRPNPRILESPIFPQLHREGEALGHSWRSSFPRGTAEELRGFIQQKWMELLPSKLSGQRARDWQANWNGAKAFGEGVVKGAGTNKSYVPLGIGGTAAAVVHAGVDPYATLALLNVLDTLPFQEIIIVSGGMQEFMLSVLREHPRATISHLPEGMDPNISRALGAKLTGADIVVFLDGGQRVQADALARFLWACDGRLDVALNERSLAKNPFHLRGTIDRFHEFLNVSLGRADLKINTLAALPFALSRTALDQLGPNTLAVPVKAHAAAVLKGLRIGAVASVEWKYPSQADASARGLTRLAAGDHLEAWRAAMEARGKRLYFGDQVRNRKAVGGVVYDADIHHNPQL